MYILTRIDNTHELKSIVRTNESTQNHFNQSIIFKTDTYKEILFVQYCSKNDISANSNDTIMKYNIFVRPDRHQTYRMRHGNYYLVLILHLFLCKLERVRGRDILVRIKSNRYM